MYIVIRNTQKTPFAQAPVDIIICNKPHGYISYCDTTHLLLFPDFEASVFLVPSYQTLETSECGRKDGGLVYQLTWLHT